MNSSFLVPIGMFAALTAHAQRTASTVVPGLAVERFVPGLGPAVFLGTESVALSRPWTMSAAASISVSEHSLRLEKRFGGAFSEPVRWTVAMDLGLELGVFRRLAIAVGVPIRLYAEGDRLRGTGLDDRPLDNGAVGDLRLRAKVHLWQRGPFALGAILQVTFPGGGQDDFFATSGVTFEPRLIADLWFPRAAFAANVGVRFMPERQILESRFGHELTWSVAASVLVARGPIGLWFVPELIGVVDLTAGHHPSEFRAALRFGRAAWLIDLGAGAGLGAEPAAPAWRVFVAFRSANRR